MQKMRYGAQVLFLVGMATVFSSQIDAAAAPYPHPATAAGAQLIQMAKEIYIGQFIQTYESLSVAPVRLIDLGYDGKNKAEIIASLEASSKNMRKILNDTATGQWPIAAAARTHDPAFIMKNVQYLVGIAQKMSKSKDAVRNAIGMLQNTARIVVSHGEFNQTSAIPSVMTAKYVLELVNGVYKWIAIAPDEISGLVKNMREMHRDIPVLNDSYRWTELLSEGLGLATDDMLGLYDKLIEIYSSGFVKLVADFANKGEFDVNRKDDSGETLLEWARRVELPFVVEGLKGLDAE